MCQSEVNKPMENKSGVLRLADLFESIDNELIFSLNFFFYKYLSNKLNTDLQKVIERKV